MHKLAKIVVTALACVGAVELNKSYQDKKNSPAPGTDEWARLHPAAPYASPR